MQIDALWQPMGRGCFLTQGAVVWNDCDDEEKLTTGGAGKKAKKRRVTASGVHLVQPVEFCGVTLCCQAMTATCLACSMQMSVSEFCALTNFPDCPADRGVSDVHTTNSNGMIVAAAAVLVLLLPALAML